jgi:hypothetical protein
MDGSWLVLSEYGDITALVQLLAIQTHGGRGVTEGSKTTI